MLSSQPYKGTRDFYPQDMRIRNWMFGKLRGVLTRFGYQEYDGPMLEPFELYSTKTSDEIVNEQLYWLVDRGERKLAVRPEMTPTLARMVAAKQNELPKPIRWFSIPNLWRYERPQRGRLREHWQLNVDVFGGGSGDQSILSEDFEILQIAAAIMTEFGAKSEFEVRLNHRELTNFIFKDHLKLSDDKLQNVGRLLDASLKMGLDNFKIALTKEGLNEAQINFLTSLLTKDGVQAAEKVLSSHSAYQHIKKLISSLENLGLKNIFRYDPSIMRGFLYYTGLVLEVYDLHPDNNRALFGGGRYDNLVGMFEKTSPLPGVGFGMGDVTLCNFLEVHKLLPDFKELSGVYISFLTDAEWIEAQKLAVYFREQSKNKQGLPVFTSLQSERPKKSFVTAEKLLAKYILFIGPDDVTKGVFPGKNLSTGELINLNATGWAALLF